jgi:hypothetical protein
MALAFALSLAASPGVARAAMAIEGDWVGEDGKGRTVRLTVARGKILQFDAPGVSDLPRWITSVRCSRGFGGDADAMKNVGHFESPSCIRFDAAAVLFLSRVVQHDRAGLQQRLQVGDNFRPAARHRPDQLRGLALDGVYD